MKPSNDRVSAGSEPERQQQENPYIMTSFMMGHVKDLFLRFLNYGILNYYSSVIPVPALRILCGVCRKVMSSTHLTGRSVVFLIACTIYHIMLLTCLIRIC